MKGKDAQKNFGAVGTMAPTPLSLKTWGGEGGAGGVTYKDRAQPPPPHDHHQTTMALLRCSCTTEGPSSKEGGGACRNVPVGTSRGTQGFGLSAGVWVGRRTFFTSFVHRQFGGGGGCLWFKSLGAQARPQAPWGPSHAGAGDVSHLHGEPMALNGEPNFSNGEPMF